MLPTIVAAVAGLTLMVILHELGHLLAARALGVRVEEFTVGQGPSLLRARLGGTLFSLRLLTPFGGAVKLAGIHDPEETGAFAARAVWRRASIILAGPAVNLLLALLFLWISFALELPPLPAFEAALRDAVEMTALLGGFAGDLLTGEGFFGPVPGLLEDAVGADGGSWSTGRWLRLLALIGLYLGLFNLLPILPLDGGRLALLAAEALRGRPLAPRTVGGLMALGVAFMTVLALFLVYEDLRRLLG